MAGKRYQYVQANVGTYAPPGPLLTVTLYVSAEAPPEFGLPQRLKGPNYSFLQVCQYLLSLRCPKHIIVRLPKNTSVRHGSVPHLGLLRSTLPRRRARASHCAARGRACTSRSRCTSLSAARIPRALRRPNGWPPTSLIRCAFVYLLLFWACHRCLESKTHGALM